MKKGETFDRMQSIAKYFRNQADSNPAFKPEFDLAEMINSKINGLEELTINEVEEMIFSINDMKDEEHYNGSGWLDYKMHFSALMKVNGFEISWGSNKKMKIKTVANKS